MPGPRKLKIPCSRPSLGRAELGEIGRVFESRWLGMGAVVEKFELALEKFLGAKNVIAVNTGTSALHIALDSAGIQHGDEVVLPSLTFVASVQAILACGAKPVFCEVYPETLTISTEDVHKRLTRRTKAIMPVHFGGVPCHMDELFSLGRRKGLRIVEDAAHAFGSSYKGKKIGAFGDLTCFSFDPIKNITCGEGGAVATPHDGMAEIIKKKRILGIDKEAWKRKGTRSVFNQVNTQGYRYHMSNINAAIGLVQLTKAGEFIGRKNQICMAYDSAFGQIEEIDLIKRDYGECAAFFYVIKVRKNRGPLREHLRRHGIETQVHYTPNHMQPLFREKGVKLPVTERLWREMLTLPLYYEMTNDDVEKIIREVRRFFKR